MKNFLLRDTFKIESNVTNIIEKSDIIQSYIL